MLVANVISGDFDALFYINAGCPQYHPPAPLLPSSMSTKPSDSPPGLPTELLIRIFVHLHVADLLSVQRTCRRFCDIISGSAALQYILHTEINLVEDLLPPDVSLHDRLDLLKRHETAWKDLQLNEVARFAAGEEPRDPSYILQDGYLIYNAVTNTTCYKYTDLYSSSTLPSAEARWTHISLAVIRPPSNVVFAVDHNLVVAIWNSYSNAVISFFQFTTGARHPLSLVYAVPLPHFGPRNPEVEVFGDYILVTTTDGGEWGHSEFFVVSWKTGTTKRLYHCLGPLRVVVIDPDNSLVALIKDATNSFHICKLQLEDTRQSMDTLCFLRLPLLNGRDPVSMFMVGKEWIPTAKPQDRTASQTSRGRPFPFRSYRAGTIALILNYKTPDKGLSQYAMFVSVEALLSSARSGVQHVPWADWGPAGTRVLPFGKSILPSPAGPFWITSYAPLVVRDYDPLRAGYTKKKKRSKSSTPSRPSLGPPSTKLSGEHWAEGKLETHLPFRKFVADGLFLKRVAQVVADREWVVVISRTRSGKGTTITVYHVG